MLKTATRLLVILLFPTIALEIRDTTIWALRINR